MRKFLLGLVALAAIATPIALTAAPANAAGTGADTRPCVTAGEFDKVHRGMTAQQVHWIFDTAGHYQTYWSDPWYADMRDVYRDYPACPGFNRGQRVEINFDNYSSWDGGMRMWSKTRHATPWG